MSGAPSFSVIVAKRFLERGGRSQVGDEIEVARRAGIHVKTSDPCALGLESTDDCCADSACRAGHQRDTPAQVFRYLILLQC